MEARWNSTNLVLFLIVNLWSYIAICDINPHIAEIIEEKSIKKGLNPRLVSAIVIVESGGWPYTIGGKGEIGLMQLRPEFFPDVDFNYIKNIELGTSHLKYIKRRKGAEFPDSWWVFYNWGPNSKVRAPKKTEYYRKVMRAYKR